MIARNPIVTASDGPLEADVVVIGSGAGGSVVAATLARRGIDVLLLEEGPHRTTRQHSANMTDAMRHLWRNGGISPILGRPHIGFAEGRCVGGSTEINSALYHRTPEPVLRRWEARYRLKRCTPALLDPCFRRVEKATNVSYGNDVHRNEWPLRRGADALGWRWQEVGRMHKECVNLNTCGSGCRSGGKQSMSVTYIRDALAAGLRLLPDCRATKLEVKRNRVTGIRARVGSAPAAFPITIRPKHVFVCCGPIQTPALLRRSGIRHNVGNTLQLHPTLKVLARFDEEMNAHQSVLPACQVHEFGPDIKFGASLFSPAFAALSLSDNWDRHGHAMRNWRRMGLYYVSIRCAGRGWVRNIPGSGGAVLARYALTPTDRHRLSIGLGHLLELLLAGGAKEIHLPFHGGQPIRSRNQCTPFLMNELPVGRANLIAIHAFSTCPIGEDRRLCAADSHGKVFNLDNLYISDAGMLPDSPGVNPQGTIMALALRNAEHFLESL